MTAAKPPSLRELLQARTLPSTSVDFVLDDDKVIPVEFAAIPAFTYEQLLADHRAECRSRRSACQAPEERPARYVRATHAVCLPLFVPFRTATRYGNLTHGAHLAHHPATRRSTHRLH